MNALKREAALKLIAALYTYGYCKVAETVALSANMLSMVPEQSRAGLEQALHDRLVDYIESVGATNSRVAKSILSELDADDE